MTGVVLVTGVLMLTAGLHQAGCMVYHVTFLGRTNSQSKVGELHYQGTSNSPTVTNEVGCIWEKEGSSNIKKLLPNGTCPGLIPNAVGISEAGFKVESSDDFILHVYQSDSTGALADGFLAIPDEHLGNEYYVITYCSLGGFCQFAVVGTVDKTSVNIVFPRQVSPTVITCNGVTLPASAPPGDPIPFSLNENEVLHFESSASKTDLSGTFIASSHDVSVFVGARDVPSASGSAAYMIEQIPPVNKWGTDFVVAPNVLNDAGDIIKIVSQSEETTVHILGFSPFTISDKGEGVEWRIDWEMHSSVRASKPVLIVQVMSLYIYNDTEIVTGSPAMVLVPHIEQWTDEEVYSDCLQNAENQSVLVTVAETEYSTGLIWEPQQPNGNTWKTINGSNFSVLKIGPTSPESEERLSRNKISRATYGYCDGKSAVLSAAKWDWKNEECIPTAPVPGDRVDNDCDGRIDEDNCTQNDASIEFTSEVFETGAATLKSINVKGASPVRIRVQSCNIVEVALKTRSDPIMSYTALITPSFVSQHVCTPQCRELPLIENNANCSEEQTYTIAWGMNEISAVHGFKIGDNEPAIRQVDQGIDYDVMYVTAFYEPTTFVIELPEKDCGKIKSGDFADSFGLEFIVPLADSDTSYHIFLTNINELSVRVTLRGENDQLNLTKTVYPNKTERVTKDDFKSSSVIGIEADDEISVYVRRQLSPDKVVGYSAIPVDVLGPSYHIFFDSTSDTASTTENVCSWYEIKGNTESNDGPVPVIITKAVYDKELGNQKLFTANRPIAMFCGADGSMAQMPPRETLGKQHYIPPLQLDDAREEAKIQLVATEDSTVVIIRGDYDNLVTVELTGSPHSRTMEANMTYDIWSTKPIQVHLQIQSKNDDNKWASVVPIPPVEQYKKEHIFPGGLKRKNLTKFKVYSVAVDEYGAPVEYKVDKTKINETDVQRIKCDNKMFSLTIFKKKNDGRTFIEASDVMYKDINKVCKITHGTPGDGIDNDCDGLIDEEQCTTEIEPGAIDADIDGQFNEDCAIGTNPASLSVIDFDLSAKSTTCSDDQGNKSEDPIIHVSNIDEDGGISIDNGVLKSGTIPPTAHPNEKVVSHGVGPPYAPIGNVRGGLILPNTTADSNSSTPEETCSVDCVCPCSWVEKPKNYTTEELAALVTRIQEKLKVTKKSLSSTIRSKSSAKDKRTEAAAVGIVGLVFIIVMFSALFALDLTTIVHDFRMLIRNLRQAFRD